MRASIRLPFMSCLVAMALALAGCGSYMQGNMALRDGRPDEAAAHYRQALDGTSGDFARSRLGLALTWADKPGEAEAELRKAVREQPDEWAPPYYLAGAQACQGRTGEAAATLQTVRDVFRPKFAEELRDVGAGLIRSGMSCPALARALWEAQLTAEDNQRWREARERQNSH